jgi:hypothetical protein
MQLQFKSCTAVFEPVRITLQPAHRSNSYEAHPTPRRNKGRKPFSYAVAAAWTESRKVASCEAQQCPISSKTNGEIIAVDRSLHWNSELTREEVGSTGNNPNFSETAIRCQCKSEPSSTEATNIPPSSKSLCGFTGGFAFFDPDVFQSGVSLGFKKAGFRSPAQFGGSGQKGATPHGRHVFPIFNSPYSCWSMTPGFYK